MDAWCGISVLCLDDEPASESFFGHAFNAEENQPFNSRPGSPSIIHTSEDGAKSGSKAPYLLKHTVSGTMLCVHLSDGKCIWSSAFTLEELSELNKQFNPSVEIEGERLLEVMSKTMLSGGEHAQYAVKNGNGDGMGYGNDEGTDQNTTICMVIDTTTPARVKLHWEVNLEPGSSEDIYEHLTAPLVAMLAANLKYISALEVCRLNYHSLFYNLVGKYNGVFTLQMYFHTHIFIELRI